MSEALKILGAIVFSIVLLVLPMATVIVFYENCIISIKLLFIVTDALIVMLLSGIFYGID